MKKLLFLLAFLPVLGFGQSIKSRQDTLTFERDTMIKVRLTDMYYWSLVVKTDTLTGTKNGTVSVMVANSLDETRNTPPDSIFILYGSMTDSLKATGVKTFQDNDGTLYEWLGLKFTKGSITKWHIRNELLYKSK